jgi:HPt (histidine-containing phosphotransfer) domain-containing protein
MARNPAENLAPATRERYEALRKQFLAGLSRRWQEIECAADPAARAAALHRLAGAAGTYGFDELGRAARAAERLADSDAEPAFADALAEVDRLVRRALAA